MGRKLAPVAAGGLDWGLTIRIGLGQAPARIRRACLYLQRKRLLQHNSTADQVGATVSSFFFGKGGTETRRSSTPKRSPPTKLIAQVLVNKLAAGFEVKLRPDLSLSKARPSISFPLAAIGFWVIRGRSVASLLASLTAGLNMTRSHRQSLCK